MCAKANKQLRWPVAFLCVCSQDSSLLTSYFLYVFRGSAQPVGTDGITVTRTSPAPSTQKTSGASSVTVGTSYRGCTYGSMSSCDAQLRQDRPTYPTTTRLTTTSQPITSSLLPNSPKRPISLTSPFLHPILLVIQHITTEKWEDFLPSAVSLSFIRPATHRYTCTTE